MHLMNLPQWFLEREDSCELFYKLYRTYIFSIAPVTWFPDIIQDQYIICYQTGPRYELMGLNNINKIPKKPLFKIIFIYDTKLDTYLGEHP